MTFSLVLSALLINGDVHTAVVEQGLPYEDCMAKSEYLQESIDNYLDSEDYDIVAIKTFCIVNKG